MEGLPYVSAVVYAVVALAAARLHLRARAPASGWLLLTLGSLAFVVVVGLVVPDPPVGLGGRLLQDILVIALSVFPYALYRFGASFHAAPPRGRHLALAALVGLALATFAAPATGSTTALDPPWWFWPYAVAFLLYWTILTIAAARSLLAASRGQPSVARRRMRLLSAGGILLNVALLVSVQQVAPSTTTTLVTTVLAWASAGLFLLGFAPPAALRRWWRQDEERAIRHAEARLVAATTPAQVATAVLPGTSELFGGRGALLADVDGSVIGRHGLSSEAATALVRRAVQDDRTILPDLAALRLVHGWLLVRTSPAAPFFGEDELALLAGVGTSIDLALARIAEHGRERAAQAQLARTNEELTALVYGISHDLRNPIVTMLGYLELLQAEAPALSEEARHFLTRLGVSARYMDALITDLLELSRVGRTQTETGTVDLATVARDVGAEIARVHPGAVITVDDLPAVRMNGVRARQLLTNLLENAVRHGGRSDISVHVRVCAADARSAEISVVDDGVGIAPQYRERVFGIFERLDGGLERGTGIGLTMCRRIVEEMGGRLWIADSAQGTDLRMTLPLAATRADAAEVA